MNQPRGTRDHADPYQLQRFIDAQKETYPVALAELRNGRKESHWMWFIFPQIDGLGASPTTKYYAIKNVEEAQIYLDHPILGKRLLECAEAVLAIKDRPVAVIFNHPDDLKFQSCMTLFASICGQGSIFDRNLIKYYNGIRDPRTMHILEQLKIQ